MCASPSSEWVSDELHRQDTLELSLYPAVARVFKTGCNSFLFLHILLIIHLFTSSFASFSWFPSPAVHIAHLFDTCTQINPTIGSITVRRAAFHYVQRSVLPFVLPLLKRKICLYHHAFDWRIRLIFGGLVFDIVQELRRCTCTLIITTC